MRAPPGWDPISGACVLNFPTAVMVKSEVGGLKSGDNCWLLLRLCILSSGTAGLVGVETMSLGWAGICSQTRLALTSEVHVHLPPKC